MPEFEIRRKYKRETLNIINLRKVSQAHEVDGNILGDAMFIRITLPGSGLRNEALHSMRIQNSTDSTKGCKNDEGE